jgi:hypothetical protein
MSKLEAQLGDQPDRSRRIAVANAISASLKEFDEVQLGDSVLVISDGVNEPMKDVGTAIKRIERAGVRVYAFLFEPPSVFKRPEEQSFVLHRIAEDTGGSVIEVPRTLDLKQPGIERSIRIAAQRMAVRLAFTTVLSVPNGNSVPGQDKLKIELATRGRYRLNYPRVFPNCKENPRSASAQ